MTTSTLAAPTVAEAPTAAPRAALTNQDRCDACGAQAYVAATVKGSELLYCGHHATKFEAKLKPLASIWHDERSKLNG